MAGGARRGSGGVSAGPSPFEVRIPVRFADVDGMGHVNNAKYFTFFEVARTELMRLLLGFRSLAEVNFILASTSCEFRSALNYGETARVETWPTRVGNSSFELAYRITAEPAGRLSAEGRSVQVMFDYGKGAKMPVDDALRTKLEALIPNA